MQIRLYIDEDAMSRALIRGLRSRGIDVTTTLEEGMVGQSDRAQLEYAAATGRVFFTFNIGDFCRLHKHISHIEITILESWLFTANDIPSVNSCADCLSLRMQDRPKS
jgi:hypothetical protein